MACIECGKGKKRRGICDVHLLIEGDNSERLVKWCELCGAYICDNCRGNVKRRAEAAAIKAGQRIKSVFTKNK